jgi:hypothetical protein
MHAHGQDLIVARLLVDFGQIDEVIQPGIANCVEPRNSRASIILWRSKWIFAGQQATGNDPVAIGQWSIHLRMLAANRNSAAVRRSQIVLVTIEEQRTDFSYTWITHFVALFHAVDTNIAMQHSSADRVNC